MALGARRASRKQRRSRRSRKSRDFDLAKRPAATLKGHFPLPPAHQVSGAGSIDGKWWLLGTLAVGLGAVAYFVSKSTLPSVQDR